MEALAYNYAQYFCHSASEMGIWKVSGAAPRQSMDALPTVNSFSILKPAHLFKSAHCYNLRHHLARPLAQTMGAGVGVAVAL